MASFPEPTRFFDDQGPERVSKAIIGSSASNELVFAVVGHAGSGTSTIALQLQKLLKESKLADKKIDVVVLKAREVIRDWAARKG